MTTSNINAAGNEITSLFDEAERVLAEAASTTGDRAEQLKKQGAKLMTTAIEKARGFEKVARDSARAIASSTDTLVHENPWRALAIAGAVGASIGVVLGVALARK